MITIEQRIELLKGGYTPEQIAAFEQPTEQPKEQPTEQPKEQPTEQPKEQPTEQPKEQPTEQPTEQPKEQPIDISKVLESNKLIMDNIAKLTAAIQANAIASAVQPNGGPTQYTGDQAIAEIIAPPRQERK